MYALVLCTVMPEHTTQIMRRAQQYAYNRVICGHHWKSDTDASLVLASTMFAYIVCTDAYQAQLAKARAEYQALKGDPTAVRALDATRINLGYSQGGQTSIGVLRLLAEKYPDIKVTHTVAGGGPYDIGETYRQLVEKGESSQPSTVISSVLSYNEFSNLGIKNEDIFKEDIVNKIPKYLLSKDYKRPEIEEALGVTKVADMFQPVMFDFDSDISKKLMAAFENDNLCQGWTPRGNERISLVHNKLDGCVPYANATKIVDFFKQQGFKVDGKSSDRYVDGNVYLNDFSLPDGALKPDLGAHEAGALYFAIEFLLVASHYLELEEPWFDLSDIDL